MKYKLYLDDARIPTDLEWILVRNYSEFVEKVKELGLSNIKVISLDHDLGELDHEGIVEKTGYDAAKWLIEHYCDQGEEHFPEVYTHSANPIGSENIIRYINNFLKSRLILQRCDRSYIPFTV